MRRDLHDALQQALQTTRLGRRAVWHRQTDSTNTQALRAAQQGAVHGFVVAADSQTDGRGRFERQWEADAGLNVLFSVVLRPDLDTAHLGVVSLATALAVVEAIDAQSSAKAHVKWPNDVLIGEQKVCGLLIETTLSTTSRPTLVVGVGLNVNQTSFASPLPQATSLLLETGQHTDRVALLACILDRMETHLDQLASVMGRQAVLQAYQSRLVHLHKRIAVYQRQFGAPVVGTCEGVGTSGELLLRTHDGLHALHAGDVSLRPG
ncbi:MAG: biotin--[acetyl-CoA-carboxylase] ligase [Bacteroidota bacterium]